jgi:hypothetical protein
MLHAALNRMKCEADQRAEERAREAVASARHVDDEYGEGQRRTIQPKRLRVDG